MRTHRPALQGHDAQPRRGRRFVQIRLRVDEAAARAQAEANLTFLEREDQPPMCSQDPVSFAEQFGAVPDVSKDVSSNNDIHTIRR